MNLCCCSSKPVVHKKKRCNIKCNDEDVVLERKDRIQFDLNTIIKANTIRKSKDLGNYKANQKIHRCNEKLSYLNIIEKLQIEIDSITHEILNYNDETDEYIDTKGTSVKKTSQISKIPQRNIEYLKNILRYKTDSRNHYINLINDIINFKGIDPKKRL